MPLFFFFLALAGPFPEGGRFPALLFLFTLPPEEALIAGCLCALPIVAVRGALFAIFYPFLVSYPLYLRIKT